MHVSSLPFSMLLKEEVSALAVEGRRIEGEAEGLFARVLQHEVDHLDGILYPMRMRDLRLLAFASELHHLEGWLRQEGAPG